MAYNNIHMMKYLLTIDFIHTCNLFNTTKQFLMTNVLYNKNIVTNDSFCFFQFPSIEPIRTQLWMKHLTEVPSFQPIQ